MTARHENQMIDQIDAQGPQEERGILSRAYVGLARRGNARGVVVRHDHRPDPAAEQGPPTLWRDDAAPRRIALDALEAGEAVGRVESGQQQRFAKKVEQRAQHTAGHVIPGSDQDDYGRAEWQPTLAEWLQQGTTGTHD